MKDRPRWLPRWLLSDEPNLPPPANDAASDVVTAARDAAPEDGAATAGAGEAPRSTAPRETMPALSGSETAPVNLPAFDAGNGGEEAGQAVPGAQLQPKELFAGRFYIVRLLALGGMAEVYEAYDMADGRPCALKIQRLQYNRSEKLRLQMTAEARALIEVKHPHVVEAWAAGVTPQGIIYIAMELLTGATLHEHIHGAPGQPRPPLVPLRRALTWVAELSSAAHRLHEAGIIHRDLKPENVFVTLDGHIKILDLGAAKFRCYGLQTTGAHKTIGTPPYMSPEHLRGDKTIDARSDVYSLGHVFYEVIAGEHAFYSPAGVYSAESYRLWQEQRRPESLAEKRPGIHELVDALVLKALEKKREDRWQSCKQMQAAALGLLEVLGEKGLLDVEEDADGLGVQAGLVPYAAVCTTAEAVAGVTLEPPVVRITATAESAGGPHGASATTSAPPSGAAPRSDGPRSGVVPRTARGTEILATGGSGFGDDVARSRRVTQLGTEIVEVGGPASPAAAQSARPPAGDTVPIEAGPPDSKREMVEVLRERVRAEREAGAGAEVIPNAPPPEPNGGSLEVVTTDPAVRATGARAKRAAAVSSRRPIRWLAPAAMLAAGAAMLATGTMMLFLGRRAPAVAEPAALSTVTVGAPASAPSATVEAAPAGSTTVEAAPAGSATAKVTATATVVPVVTRAAPPAPRKAPVPSKASAPARTAHAPFAPQQDATAAPAAAPEDRPRRKRLPSNPDPRPKSDRIAD
jgi:eukaryotic-like serine/threonine-protein kinase